MEKEITERLESTNENSRAGTKSPPHSQPLSGIQRALGNEAMGRLLGAGVVQAKLRVSQPGDADENEADAVAQRVMSRQSSGVVQRKCDCGGSCAKCQEDQEDGGVIHRSAVGGMSWVPLSIQRAEAEGGSSEGKPKRDESRHPHGHPQVVVEDETPKLETGQMRKKQFLELLQTTSCATADAALEAVGHSTKGCPYIRKWLAHYREESAAHLVSAMHKYAPETRKARSAHEAISQLNQRVERAALSWAKTGKVSGLPEGMQAEMLGAGEGGSALSKFASSGFGKGLLGFLGGKGGEGEISFGGKEKKKTSSGELQKKSRGEGAGATTEDASAVKEQLGSGHALDSRVQSQMSRAFGQDFSGVRVHTDAKAGELSTQLNARAFTIGSDVAFAGGEYQPGTPIGDALIAHELAHVVQQGGGTRSTEPQAKDANFEGNGQLEQDADRSAVGAVLSTWAGVKTGLAEIRKNALPRLTSGLALQKCNRRKSQLQVLQETQREEALTSAKTSGLADENAMAQAQADFMRTRNVASATSALPVGVAPTTAQVAAQQQAQVAQTSIAPAVSTLTAPEVTAWTTRAKAAVAAVVLHASAHHPELKLTAADFHVDVVGIENRGAGVIAYGEEIGGRQVATVGRTFVRFVDANPAYAMSVVVHELHGHPEYGPYGAPGSEYGLELYDKAAARMPGYTQPTGAGRTSEIDAYAYQETEIYSLLRSLPYHTPLAAADAALQPNYVDPEPTVTARIGLVKSQWEPRVAKALLRGLYQRFMADKRLSPAALAAFRRAVRANYTGAESATADDILK